MEFLFFAHRFFGENLCKFDGYIKITTRSKESKNYYWGRYGFLQTCSFLMDLANCETEIYIRGNHHKQKHLNQ